MHFKKLGLALGLMLGTGVGLANEDQTHWAHSHAPMGVMGDHTHLAGEWMVSYRYMKMNMSGLRRGDQDLTLEQSFGDFMMVPQDMEMEMHMLGFMYAPNDRITWMAMLNHNKNDMLIQNRMGMQFNTTSEGTGDSSLGILYRFKSWGDNHLHATFNWRIPTSSINPRDNTPMGPDSLLPYPMRLGSGTHDLQLGLTWNQYLESHGLGAQWLSTWRTGENDADYRLGHQQRFNFWAAKTFTPSWSASVRLEAIHDQAIQGADARLMMLSNMTPTARAQFSGGDKINFGVGLNYVSNHDNWTRGHRIGLEWINPIKQDFNGVQMQTDSSWVLAWQKAF